MVIQKKYFIKNVIIKVQIYLLLNQLMDKFLEDILLNLGLLIIQFILLTLNLSYLILIIKENIPFQTIEVYLEMMDIYAILEEIIFMNYGSKIIIFLREVGWITEKAIISLIMNYQGERTVLK